MQSRFFLNEIGVKQCFYVVMLRLCSCARRLLGAVRPGDAVQPSVRGLELDEQHRHQLRPPRRQRERRSPARGGRGRGGAQQSHQQLSQRTGLEWKRHWDYQSSAWRRAANETARVNPHRPLHRRYIIGESSFFLLRALLIQLCIAAWNALWSVSKSATVKSRIFIWPQYLDNKYAFQPHAGKSTSSPLLLFFLNRKKNTVTSSGMIMARTWKHYITQSKPVAQDMASAWHAWIGDAAAAQKAERPRAAKLLKNTHIYI